MENEKDEKYFTHHEANNSVFVGTFNIDVRERERDAAFLKSGSRGTNNATEKSSYRRFQWKTEL